MHWWVTSRIVYFILYNKEPMESLQNGCGGIKSFCSLQDSNSTVSNVLEFQKPLIRDPDKECVIIVQPRGDKEMDSFFRACRMRVGTRLIT